MKKMILTAIVLILTSVLYGQEKVVKERFVEIPPEKVLLTIANQPNCPIKIEKARLLFNLDSREMRFVYELRNSSDKKIRNFVLSKWHLGGGGGDLSSVNLDSNNLLLPNQTKIMGEPENSIIIPLNEASRNELQLKTGMTSVVILFVKEVWFQDKTRYENEKTLDNFIYFSNRLILEEIN